jgi:hypothetical protein
MTSILGEEKSREHREAGRRCRFGILPFTLLREREREREREKFY